MKKILYIIPMLLLSLTACQKENENRDNNDPNAVRINATIGNAAIEDSNPLSRTAPTAPAAEDKWQTGDVIAVSNNNGLANYTFSGTAWTVAGSDYLTWDAQTMQFTAYHPVIEGVSMSNFALPTDQSTPAKIAKADYMTFSGEKTRPNDSNIINLELARKTARIILSVSAGIEYDGQQPTISDVKINSAYSGYAGASATGSVTPITPCLLNTKRYALVIPTAAAADKAFITLKISFTGGSRDLTLTGIPTLEAGNSYTITLTAGKDKLTMGGITAGRWGEGTWELITSEPVLTDVYAYFNDNGGYFQGKVYKNKNEDALYNRCYYEIMKSGDDVYSVENPNYQTMKIWKNNQELFSYTPPAGYDFLISEYRQASMTIFNNDIYTIACIQSSDDFSYRIWKNNAECIAPPSFIDASDDIWPYRLVSLPDGVYAGAHSFATRETYIYKVGENTPRYTFSDHFLIRQMIPVGTDVYIAGTMWNQCLGVILKNDQVIFSSVISNDNRVEMMAIKKVGNTLYFAEVLRPQQGYAFANIRVYKGDISVQNPKFEMISEIRPPQGYNQAWAYDMAVAPNDDIYIAGYTYINSSNTSTPTVWKNGTVYRTYNGNGAISAIELVSK